MLLASVLDLDRSGLYLCQDPLGREDQASFRALIARRQRREPLQYILGEAPFYGRFFGVNGDVLIPRPETELLVDEVLKRSQRPLRIVDVGTGSGCIAVTLACECPRARVVAVDRSLRALRAAQANGARYGVADRIRWICADILAGLRPGYRAELIVANLPYVARGELPALQPEVSAYEPWEALNGGSDGLSLIAELCVAAPRVLAGGGLLALEIGDQQAAAVQGLEEIFCNAAYGSLSGLVID
jgi:release factor glutamine methyltransferase